MFAGENPVLGDVLLAINGVHCEEAVDARSDLRRAIAAGGRVFVKLWTPPVGWTPPAPDGDSRGTSTIAHDCAGAASLPQWEEEEMRCVVRISCRMFGGTKDKANVVAMCGALDLDDSGSSVVLQRRLEQELLKRNVPDLVLKAFDHSGVLREIPSNDEVSDRTHAVLNERHGDTFFRLPQIVALLRCIPAKSSGDSRVVVAPTTRSSSQAEQHDETAGVSFACAQLSQIAAAQHPIAITLLGPAQCLPSTSRNIPHSERQHHQFFERADITIGDPATARAIVVAVPRTRPLSDDWCPVFEHGDGSIGLVRLRVDDISRDADGAAWLHGYPLYSKSQLPASAAAALPSGFDDDRELVESIDAYQVRAGDVCGIVPVVSSSALRAVRASSGCHHEAAFVEEFDDTGKWKSQTRNTGRRRSERRGGACDRPRAAAEGHFCGRLLLANETNRGINGIAAG